MQLPTESVRQGIKNFLSSYVEIRKEDFVIVSFWNKCVDIASWLIYELEETGNKTEPLPFSSRDESAFIVSLDSLLDSLKDSHKRIVIIVCEDRFLSFSNYLRDLNSKENIVVWRMMNSSSHLFEEAFSATRRDLRNVNAWLLSKLATKDNLELVVRNKYNTQVNLTINNKKHHWISTCGYPAKDELIILPTGEINTFPENINGLFVAFGAMHSNIDIPFDVRLEKNPVFLQIENGVLAEFSCQNNLIYSFLKNIFCEQNMPRVGEFGIGTNLGISSFTAENTHTNERFPGVHLGFGMHLQKNKSVNYKTDIHIDFISPYGFIDIIENGRFSIDLKNLSPIETAHPLNIPSEEGN